MRIFKNKPFARFARKAEITDGDLRDTVADIANGLIDADLGGGLVKQRVSRRGSGKSDGFRVILVIRVGERAFFVHGFAKNERENIRKDELAALKKLAAMLMDFDEAALDQAVVEGALMEVLQ